VEVGVLLISSADPQPWYLQIRLWYKWICLNLAPSAPPEANLYRYSPRIRTGQSALFALYHRFRSTSLVRSARESPLLYPVRIGFQYSHLPQIVSRAKSVSAMRVLLHNNAPYHAPSTTMFVQGVHSRTTNPYRATAAALPGSLATSAVSARAKGTTVMILTD